MNASLINPTILDPAAFERLDRWGGDDLVRQMARLFLESSPGRLDTIRGALGQEHPGELPERMAHLLKSSAANVGAHRVQSLATEMEAAARSAEPARMRELLPALGAALAESCAELARVLGGVDSDDPS